SETPDGRKGVRRKGVRNEWHGLSKHSVNRAAALASASSSLNLRVQPLQFCPGVVDFELPVHSALFGIRFIRPDPDLGLQQRQLADTAVTQALAGQATQFTFGD